MFSTCSNIPCRLDPGNMGKNLLCFLLAWSQAPQHHRASEALHFLCRTEHQSQGQARPHLSTEKVTNLTNVISSTLDLFVKSIPVPGVWTQLNFTPASSEKNSADLGRSPCVKQIIQIAINISKTSTSVFKVGTFCGSNFFITGLKSFPRSWLIKARWGNLVLKCQSRVNSWVK